MTAPRSTPTDDNDPGSAASTSRLEEGRRRLSRIVPVNCIHPPPLKADHHGQAQRLVGEPDRRD